MPPVAAQPAAAIHGPAVAGQPAKQISRSFSSRFGQQGAGARPMTARPTGVGSSFSQGGSNIGAKMSSSSPSQVVTKMSDAGRAALNTAKSTTPTITRGLGALGTVARVAANPVVGGVAAAMTPTPANSGEDEKARQAKMGQSLPNVAPGQGSAKNIAPVAGGSIAANAGRTTSSASPKQTFGQAFAAARAKAAEIGSKSTGSFEYNNKTYQTNVAPTKGTERYVASSAQKSTGVSVTPKTASDTKPTPETTTPAPAAQSPGPASTPAVPSSNMSSSAAAEGKRKMDTMNSLKEEVTVGNYKYRIV